jgi:hypothetical protein
MVASSVIVPGASIAIGKIRNRGIWEDPQTLHKNKQKLNPMENNWTEKRKAMEPQSVDAHDTNCACPAGDPHNAQAARIAKMVSPSWCPEHFYGLFARFLAQIPTPPFVFNAPRKRTQHICFE